MSKIVAIIPARGGSKGIPRKNIQEIAGKPLLAYTIEAAFKSKYINRVIVSTDSPEIAKIAKSYGAEVPFLRPPELAKDDTPGIVVVQHAVRYLETVEGYPVDIVVILQPTSPLRKTKYIDAAIKKLIESGADSVVSVCEVKHHPFWSFIMKNDKLYPFIEKGLTITRRQLLPKVYSANGAVYAVKKDVLFKENSVFGKDTRAIVMPREESVDIDDYFDLFMAEMVIKYWKEWLKNRLTSHGGSVNYIG